jgi:hypothetical protein
LTFIPTGKIELLWGIIAGTFVGDRSNCLSSAAIVIPSDNNAKLPTNSISRLRLANDLAFPIRINSGYLIAIANLTIALIDRPHPHTHIVINKYPFIYRQNAEIWMSFEDKMWGS